MKAMFWIKVKLAAAVLVGAAAVGGGGAAVVIAAAEPRQEPPKVEVAATDKGIECKVTEKLIMALDRVRLSAGAEQGVREGFEFDILSGDGRKIAEVKVDVVEDRASRALVTGGDFAAIKVGDTARTRFGTVLAQPGEKRVAPPADAGKVAWGEAVNGLQAGLVPLGDQSGVAAVIVSGLAKHSKGEPIAWYLEETAGDNPRWGIACPNPKCGIMEKTSPGAGKCEGCGAATGFTSLRYCSSCAAAKRVCASCGAAKPWGATFVEGKPIALEIHVRNVGEEPRTVPQINPYFPDLVFKPAGGGAPLRPAHTGAVPSWRHPGHRRLAKGEQAAYVVKCGGDRSWQFRDASPAPRDAAAAPIESLPAGKYTVTASYEVDAANKVATGTVEIEVKPRGAAPTARKRSLEVKRSWTGVVANRALAAERPQTGFVADQEGFAKLWKAWRGAEAVPEVGFDTELVLVETAGGPNIPSIDQLPLDENGNLLVLASASRLGGGGFGYRLAVVPREGIKSVRGAPLPGR